MNILAEQPSEEIAQARLLPLIALLTANIISFVGDILMGLAIPWFVLQTTGSVVKMGITAFFSTLPAVIASFLGGLLVDRLGYKRASIVSDVICCVCVALIPLFYYSIGLAFWQLLALVFLGSLFQAPGATARSSLIPDLAKLARLPLERVNAAGDGMSRVSGFIGAPLAALLIVLIGTANLLWLDAISFLASALLISLTVARTMPVAHEQKKQGSRLAEMSVGLRFISTNPLLRALVVNIMITNLLDAANFAVFMPVYARHYLGGIVPLGLMSATFGGSAFLGTIIFGLIGQRLPRRLTVTICFLLIGMRFWLLLMVPPLPIIIASYMIMGLAAGPINPILSTVEQEIVPKPMRARVFGVISAGMMAGNPLGVFAIGYLIQWIGILPGLSVMAVCYLTATLALLVSPSLKGIERRATTQE